MHKSATHIVTTLMFHQIEHKGAVGSGDWVWFLKNLSLCRDIFLKHIRGKLGCRSNSKSSVRERLRHMTSTKTAFGVSEGSLLKRMRLIQYKSCPVKPLTHLILLKLICAKKGHFSFILRHIWVTGVALLYVTSVLVKPDSLCVKVSGGREIVCLHDAL